MIAGRALYQNSSIISHARRACVHCAEVVMCDEVRPHGAGPSKYRAGLQRDHGVQPEGSPPGKPRAWRYPPGRGGAFPARLQRAVCAIAFPRAEARGCHPSLFQSGPASRDDLKLRDACTLLLDRVLLVSVHFHVPVHVPVRYPLREPSHRVSPRREIQGCPVDIECLVVESHLHPRVRERVRSPG